MMRKQTAFYEGLGCTCNLDPLSGFYLEDIVYEGKIYKSGEHMYQSLKYIEICPEYAEIIRNIRTPYAARLLGIQMLSTNGVKWKIGINNIIKEFQKKGLPRNQEDLNIMRIVLNAIKRIS